MSASILEYGYRHVKRASRELKKHRDTAGGADLRATGTPQRSIAASAEGRRLIAPIRRLIGSPRLQHELGRLSHLGAGLGVAAFFLSLTPSLLPRPWQLQGVVTGLAVASAYAAGVVISWLGRWAGIRPLSPRAERWLWYGIAVLSALLVPVTIWLSSGWQEEVRQGVNMPAEGRYLYVGVLVIAAAVVAALIGVARLVRALYVGLWQRLQRFIPLVAARLTALVLVAAFLIGLLDGIVYRGLVGLAEATFSLDARGTDHGVVQPTSPLRSGGPGSLVPWTSLGRYGRAFVSSGPAVTKIERLTGRPAVEPIRVYAGTASSPTMQGEADLVLAELKRTGAFDRPLLAVTVPVGNGFVEPVLADPLEYMYGGNTAIASMQYSNLPSAFCEIAEPGQSREAGRTLFNTIYEYWSALPRDHRPRLVVFAESLGALGGVDAFSRLGDLTGRIDGAVFAGTPNIAGLWQQATNQRARGSLERLPVYGDGRTVVFAASSADLFTPDGSPRTAKVVFLQHASDPIVWWSIDLILREPDWLKEPHAHDVVPEMRWLPLVTFWQVTGDMFIGVAAPPGHGHHYGPEVPAAWAAILHPPGWTESETATLAAQVSGP
jgi:uncharacterized membrane protein